MAAGQGRTPGARSPAASALHPACQTPAQPAARLWLVRRLSMPLRKTCRRGGGDRHTKRVATTAGAAAGGSACQPASLQRMITPSSARRRPHLGPELLANELHGIQRLQQRRAAGCVPLRQRAPHALSNGVQRRLEGVGGWAGGVLDVGAPCSDRAGTGSAGITAAGEPASASCPAPRGGSARHHVPASLPLPPTLPAPTQQRARTCRLGPAGFWSR